MKKTVVLFKRRRDVARFLLILLVAVILLQAAFLLHNYLNSLYTFSLPAIPFSGGEAPVSLEGFEKVEVKVSPSVVYLTAGCKQLAMVTTDFQTYSIQNGLEKKIDFRPTTHDVFKDLVEGYGIGVRMVKIESLEDSTYYSKLYVQQGNKMLGLDTKPSDAIAIAVRFDAPVYISRGILDGNAKSIC